MSLHDLGLRGVRVRQDERTHAEYLLLRRPLQRLLAFRGRSIDDVVNDPIVKNEILGFWKVHKQVERTSEIVDLERQWNGRTRA